MKIDNAIINNVDFFVVEDDEGVKVKIRQQITPEQKAWIKSHEQYIKDIVITQWFINEMKQYEYLWSNGDWVAVNWETYYDTLPEWTGLD